MKGVKGLSLVACTLWEMLPGSLRSRAYVVLRLQRKGLDSLFQQQTVT